MSIVPHLSLDVTLVRDTPQSVLDQFLYFKGNKRVARPEYTKGLGMIADPLGCGGLLVPRAHRDKIHIERLSEASTGLLTARSPGWRITYEGPGFEPVQSYTSLLCELFMSTYFFLGHPPDDVFCHVRGDYEWGTWSFSLTPARLEQLYREQQSLPDHL